jgi:hypothetical protein
MVSRLVKFLEKTVLPAEAASRKKTSKKRTSDQSGHNDEGAGIGAEIAKKAERIQGTSFSGRAITRGATGK